MSFPVYPLGGFDFGYDIFGYDITDFCAVDPVFGTMADFDALLHGLHSHKIKLLLDTCPTTRPSPIPGS